MATKLLRLTADGKKEAGGRGNQTGTRVSEYRGICVCTCVYVLCVCVSVISLLKYY